MLQAYKYRMYPSRGQVPLLMHHVHACRSVYNHSLEQEIRAYEQDGQKLSCFDLSTRLPALKGEHLWLREVNSQSLQSADRNLDDASTRFFREKKGFPRFKSKGAVSGAATYASSSLWTRAPVGEGDGS